MTFEDMSSAIFFAGIGVWSFALRNAGWPDDRPVWTGSCPVSLSARPAKAKAGPTIATSGRYGIASSASAALQSSLVSRLKQRLATAGSMLYRLTWKESVTPSGRSVCLLRASGAAHQAADLVRGRRLNSATRLVEGKRSGQDVPIE